MIEMIPNLYKLLLVILFSIALSMYIENKTPTTIKIKVIKKLGIEILDKVYTKREFEVLDGEYILYYYEDDMTDEEKADTKSLEGTGASREEYNTLLKKFEKINLEHNF